MQLVQGPLKPPHRPWPVPDGPYQSPPVRPPSTNAPSTIRSPPTPFPWSPPPASIPLAWLVGARLNLPPYAPSPPFSPPSHRQVPSVNLTLCFVQTACQRARHSFCCIVSNSQSLLFRILPVALYYCCPSGLALGLFVVVIGVFFNPPFTKRLLITPSTILPRLRVPTPCAPPPCAFYGLRMLAFIT